MDGRDALRSAVFCLGGLLLMTGCPSPPESAQPPGPTSSPVPTSAVATSLVVTRSSPALPTTAQKSSGGVKTLTIPTQGLPSRTSTGPTGFSCGIPGVQCEPTQTSTTTEEIDVPSPTP